jgi:hypothetical protein
LPVYVVSREAGHESVGTTDRRYGHFDRSASVVSAAAFESMMPGVRRGMVSGFLIESVLPGGRFGRGAAPAPRRLRPAATHAGRAGQGRGSSADFIVLDL